MPDFREFDDVQYVAGQNFQSEHGYHEAGSIVEEAREFQNLQVLIDAKFLYPFAPERGYAYLPANIFNHIDLQEEVMAKLRGAPSPNPDHFADGKKPEAMLQAEREADLQYQAYASVRGARDSKENKKQREETEKQAQLQARGLTTVDANPAYQDKGGEVTKMYKGKKEAHEVLDEQSEAARKAREDTKVKLPEAPKVLRESGPDTERTTESNEDNPDLSKSKKPVSGSKMKPVKPVGDQPSNVEPSGSKEVGPTTKSTSKKKD